MKFKEIQFLLPMNNIQLFNFVAGSTKQQLIQEVISPKQQNQVK